MKARLTLPDGSPYEPFGDLLYSEPRVDPADGSITVWACFPNPDVILRPGLDVIVRTSTKSE